MSRISKDLTAASSIPLILSILKQGENYGYEIIQKVHLLSDGAVRWTDGMLYPVLHKMERRGLVTAVWKLAENGRKRKYYRISTQGLKQLKEEQAAWNLVNSIFDRLWKTGPDSI